MKFKIKDIKAGYLLKVKDTDHEDPYYMSVIPNDLDELGYDVGIIKEKED